MSSSAEAAITILIIYNATSTFLGKITYSYRHITCKRSGDENPACAACDLTHGGLHLDETAEWKAAKKALMEQYGQEEGEGKEGGDGGVEVRQLHRDELDKDVGPLTSCSFISGKLNQYAE